MVLPIGGMVWHGMAHAASEIPHLRALEIGAKSPRVSLWIWGWHGPTACMFTTSNCTPYFNL